MSTPFFTSDMRINKSFSLVKIFQVVVEDWDGESHDFEVSANDYNDAAQRGESLAWSEGIDINTIHVYQC